MLKKQRSVKMPKTLVGGVLVDKPEQTQPLVWGARVHKPAVPESDIRRATRRARARENQRTSRQEALTENIVRAQYKRQVRDVLAPRATVGTAAAVFTGMSLPPVTVPMSAGIGAAFSGLMPASLLAVTSCGPVVVAAVGSAVAYEAVRRWYCPWAYPTEEPINVPDMPSIESESEAE